MSKMLEMPVHFSILATPSSVSVTDLVFLVAGVVLVGDQILDQGGSRC